MKIKQIYISEFKSLKDLETNPEGKSIMLRGENGVGKTSVMQFCMIALGYKSEVPLKGHGEGHIIVGKDGIDYRMKVETDDGKIQKLVITTDTGLKETSKSFLKQFTGATEFDPDEFVALCETEAGSKKAVAMLKAFLTPQQRQDIDYIEVELEREEKERTESGRILEQLKGYLQQCDFSSPVEKPEDTVSLMEELNYAMKLKSKILEADKAIESYDEKIKQNESIIENLKKENIELEEKGDKCFKFLNENPIIELEPLQEKISQQDMKQKAYYDYVECCKKKEEAEKLSELRKKQTESIEEKRKERLKRIIGKSSPLDGLEVKDDGLYYLGRLVDKKTMSTSEIMTLAWLLKLAENPDMPLFVSRCESLGQEKFDALMKLSKEKGVQLILEEVKRGEEKLQIEIMEN